LFFVSGSDWFSGVPENPPTIAGFLYVTLASTAGGVVVSAIRWAIIDTIHHWTGVAAPNWNFTAYPS
jgi:hypothetical protein